MAQDALESPADIARRRLDRLKAAKAQREPLPDGVLDVHAMAARAGVSESTIYEWCANRWLRARTTEPLTATAEDLDCTRARAAKHLESPRVAAVRAAAARRNKCGPSILNVEAMVARSGKRRQTIYDWHKCGWLKACSTRPLKATETAFNRAVLKAEQAAASAMKKFLRKSPRNIRRAQKVATKRKRLQKAERLAAQPPVPEIDRTLEIPIIEIAHHVVERRRSRQKINQQVRRTIRSLKVPVVVRRGLDKNGRLMKLRCISKAALPQVVGYLAMDAWLALPPELMTVAAARREFHSGLETLRRRMEEFAPGALQWAKWKTRHGVTRGEVAPRAAFAAAFRGETWTPTAPEVKAAASVTTKRRRGRPLMKERDAEILRLAREHSLLREPAKLAALLKSSEEFHSRWPQDLDRWAVNTILVRHRKRKQKS